MKKRENPKSAAPPSEPVPARKTLRPSAALRLLSFICLCISGWSCVPQATVGLPGDGNAEIIADEFKYNGVRLEAKIRESQNLLRSSEFWLSVRDGADLAYGWESVDVRLRDAEATNCDFSRPTSECVVCNLCAVPVCNPGSGVVFTPDFPISGSLTKTEPGGQAQTLHNFALPQHGCLKNSSGFPRAEAEDNVTYTLTHKDIAGMEGRTHYKTRVVGTAVKIIKDTERFRDRRDPGALRFRFTTPLIEEGWLAENFSLSLKITGVRILLATRDKSTNRVMYSEGEVALRKVRPRRIVFLPDFPAENGSVFDNPAGDGLFRCFPDPATPDGDIKLQNCRRNEEPGSLIRDWSATPTFMHDAPRSTLTWFVEYKLTDFFTEIPTFADDAMIEEFPAIEFTLQ